MSDVGHVEDQETMALTRTEPPDAPRHAVILAELYCLGIGKFAKTGANFSDWWESGFNLLLKAQ